jgi:3-oxoacyl-[acyl-carrier-protein] synthase-1
MIVKVSDNIITPLGLTTGDNLEAILEGRSELRLHEGAFGLPEPFCGSLLDRDAVEEAFREEISLHNADKSRTGSSVPDEELTFMERLAILSASKAIREGGIDPTRDDVLFILSTTKGNVDLLAENPDDDRAYLAGSAQKIAEWFGNPNPPTVVSNACISGVCAQIAAVRALLGGRCRTAVVIGCDVLSKFIISGFQSFKALSPEPCKPYDKNRLGLNLGEGAATLILRSFQDAELSDASSHWHYISSSIHNDANHISGPSRTGEGSYRVLRDILEDLSPEELSFVNAHGTATAYNDEMESIALHRAGLDNVPVNGLKGFYGHTLGAAGVIETILSMAAADKGIILPTRGFCETGTSYALNLSSDTRKSDRKAFIKILSGFGGSNAGIAYRKGGAS